MVSRHLPYLEVETTKKSILLCPPSLIQRQITTHPVDSTSPPRKRQRRYLPALTVAQQAKTKVFRAEAEATRPGLDLCYAAPRLALSLARLVLSVLTVPSAERRRTRDKAPFTRSTWTGAAAAFLVWLAWRMRAAQPTSLRYTGGGRRGRQRQVRRVGKGSSGWLTRHSGAAGRWLRSRKRDLLSACNAA